MLPGFWLSFHVLLLTIALGIPSATLSDSLKSNCSYKLDGPHLLKLRDSRMANNILKEFSRLNSLLRECPDCEIAARNWKIFSKVYASDFILLYYEAGDFGGFFSVIWSASLADGYYRLWLYDVDSSDYQLREIIVISEFDLAPRNPKKLANKKYSNLRLCADTTHNKQMPTDR